MSTEISILMKNQAVELQVAGKLIGHVARNCFTFLRQLAEQKYSIVLDLHDCTSVDSVGVTIFDWLRRENGSVDVKVIPPLLSFCDEEFTGVKFTSDAESETVRNAVTAVTQASIIGSL
ncbi:MAG: hypothetical protein E3J72_22410 [Planctomycetota bacterium]|nr:MAG: hypothetical protein E3J72_22410 [Planctomycetota bacterium]